MLNRRAFLCAPDPRQERVMLLVLISLAVVGFLLSPRPLGAESGKRPVIAYLTPAPPGVVAFEQFRQALHDIGYVDGHDVLLIERSAGGDLTRLPHLATELVRMRVDIIVAVANEAIRAAKDSSSTASCSSISPTRIVCQHYMTGVRSSRSGA